jgi:hypothetical protein
LRARLTALRVIVLIGEKAACRTGQVTVSFKIEDGDFVVTGARRPTLLTQQV